MSDQKERSSSSSSIASTISHFVHGERQVLFRNRFGKDLFFECLMEAVAALWSAFVLEIVIAVGQLTQFPFSSVLGLVAICLCFQYMGIGYVVAAKRTAWYTFTLFLLCEVAGFLWTGTYDAFLATRFVGKDFRYGGVFVSLLIVIVVGVSVIYISAIIRHLHLIPFLSDLFDLSHSSRENKLIGCRCCWECCWFTKKRRRPLPPIPKDSSLGQSLISTESPEDGLIQHDMKSSSDPSSPITNKSRGKSFDHYHNAKNKRLEADIQNFEAECFGLPIAWAIAQNIHYLIYGDMIHEFVSESMDSDGIDDDFADDDGLEVNLRQRKNDWIFLLVTILVTVFCAFLSLFTLRNLNDLPDRHIFLSEVKRSQSQSTTNNAIVPPPSPGSQSSPGPVRFDITGRLESFDNPHGRVVKKKARLLDCCYVPLQQCFSSVGACCTNTQRLFFFWEPKNESEDSRDIDGKPTSSDHSSFTSGNAYKMLLNKALCYTCGVMWVMWSINFFRRDNIFLYQHQNGDKEKVMSADSSYLLASIVYALAVSLLAMAFIGCWAEEIDKKELSLAIDPRDFKLRRNYFLINCKTVLIPMTCIAFRLMVGWAYWDLSEAIGFSLSGVLVAAAHKETDDDAYEFSLQTGLFFLFMFLFTLFLTFVTVKVANGYINESGTFDMSGTVDDDQDIANEESKEKAKD